MATALSENRYLYSLVAILCAGIVFLGFSPSFYLKGVLHAPPPLSALTVVHGVVFTAWTLLFVAQATLIDVGNRALHRRIGVLGAVLFGVVLSLGLSTTITAARLGHIPPGAPEPLAFMALPFFGILGVAVLVLLALAKRAQSDFHKRLMLASFIMMTPPATHRLALAAGFVPEAIVIALVIANLLLAAVIAADLAAQRRLHPAYLWSAGVYGVVNLATAWGFGSPSWHAFATWVTRA